MLCWDLFYSRLTSPLWVNHPWHRDMNLLSHWQGRNLETSASSQILHCNFLFLQLEGWETPLVRLYSYCDRTLLCFYPQEQFDTLHLLMLHFSLKRTQVHVLWILNIHLSYVFTALISTNCLVTLPFSVRSELTSMFLSAPFLAHLLPQSVLTKNRSLLFTLWPTLLAGNTLNYLSKQHVQSFK